MATQINIIEQASPKNAATVDQGSLVGNTYTKNQVQGEISKSFVGSIKGEATTTTVPTPYNSTTYPNGLYEKYDVKAAGTFTNFKNSSNVAIVVTTEDLELNFVQIWVENGVSKKALSVKPIGLKLATQFSIVNSTEAQSGKAIYDGIFSSGEGQGATQTFIESAVGSVTTPINIGSSTDAILTVVDSNRTSELQVEEFKVYATSGQLEIRKYLKDGNTVSLQASQIVTTVAGLNTFTPSSTMKTLNTNEYYAIRMTTGGALTARIGFVTGGATGYNCYSNTATSGSLPNSMTLGSSLSSKVGFNFSAKVAGLSIFSQKFAEEYVKQDHGNSGNSENKLSGKIICVLGDSISTTSGGGDANLGTDKQYYGLLKTRNNCSIYVNAVAGSSIMTGGQGSVDFTNDARIDSMTAYNPNIILIFGGINDFLQDLPLGTFGDTSKTASFFGALDYLYRRVLTQNKGAKVFHMTPLHTTFADGGGLIPEFNGQNYLTEYVDAIHKVAQRYGVAVIDTFSRSGITAFNIDNYATDKIHIKEAGHELVYKIVVNELNRSF